MKNPWVTFAGICTLVFGIVIFCVIFGGYSSLLRSQNRIHASKLQLVTQCRELLGLAGQLPDSRTEADLINASEKITRILSAFEASEDALDPDLIVQFENAQLKLNQAIGLALEQMDMDGGENETKTVTSNNTSQESPFPQRVEQLKTAVFIMGKRYNKEARYFNTRTKIFPGFLIAQLFGLDEKHFPEIDVQRLTPNPVKEAASAS